MAHSHAEGQKPESTYFLDQLCTIAVCGMLGVTAIMGYQTWLLERIQLKPIFRPFVFAGGIAILLMVVLRAVALWRQAGQSKSASVPPDDGGHDHGHSHDEHAAHDHSHSHGHEHSHSHGHEHSHGAHDHGHGHAHGHEHSHGSHNHGHSHAHAGHDHAHSHASHDQGHEHAHGEEGHDDHDHGWAPWQYVVLLIPVVLYMFHMPNELIRKSTFEDLGPSRAVIRLTLANVTGTAALPALKSQDKPQRLKFTDLTMYAGRDSSRRHYDGRTVILVGQFDPHPTKDNQFKLYRDKVACCAADKVVLEAQIIAPEPLQGFTRGAWVEIQGELTFKKIAGRDDWLPVIELPTMQEIQRTEARDPFDNV